MNSAIAVGMLVSLVTVAPARPIRPVQLNAYDANGLKIGRILDVSGQSGSVFSEARVAVRVSGITIVLQVRRDTLGGYGRGLVFESADCTGTPYLLPEPESMLQPVTTVVPRGRTVYAPQPGASERLITTQSGMTASQGCLPSNALNVKVIPAVPLIDLSTLFTAPFSIR